MKMRQNLAGEGAAYPRTKLWKSAGGPSSLWVDTSRTVVLLPVLRVHGRHSEVRNTQKVANQHQHRLTDHSPDTGDQRSMRHCHLLWLSASDSMCR